MRRYYLLMLLAALPGLAQGQLLTFGVKGGVPAQTPLGETGSQMPFILGPTVTIRVMPRLSLESGVLFHRMGRTNDTGVFLYPENSITLTSSVQRVTAIELPFLAKYSLLGERHAWRPFVTAGPTVRRTSFTAQHQASILAGSSLVNVTPGQLLKQQTVKWNVDPTVGAGVEFKTGRIHLEPEVRYSYWGAGKNAEVRKNQVSYLLGFRF
jgi:hypothetical protein